MQWHNDKYKDLKYVIFDILREELAEHDAKLITVKKLTDSIDLMFDKLLEHIMKE